MRIANQVCIASHGEVLSVRLFSKVPFSSIQTLALDQSSMTSNALVQIILAESYQVRPKAEPHPPCLEEMLAENDAALLIGDLGMDAEGAGLQILDLGQAWRDLTGLPFVWALWTGQERLTPELVGLLIDAKEESGCGRGLIPAEKESFFSRLFMGREIERQREKKQAPIIAQAMAQSGWDEAKTRHYLTQVMDYTLMDEGLECLRVYGDLCVSHGLLARAESPEVVAPHFAWSE
jgi:chorismate dehydratase